MKIKKFLLILGIALLFLIGVIVLIIINSIKHKVLLVNNEVIMNDSMQIVDQIIYEFQDSSVPPQYHRSYQLAFTPEKVVVSIDSYGDILLEKELDFTQDQFNKLLDKLAEYEIKNKEKNEDQGCTGGTGEGIKLYKGVEEIFNGYVYHCGGQDYGNLNGFYELFFSDVKSSVPDLSELVKSTEE